MYFDEIMSEAASKKQKKTPGRILLVIWILYAISFSIFAIASASASTKVVISERHHGEKTFSYYIDSEQFLYSTVRIKVHGYYIADMEPFMDNNTLLPSDEDARGLFQPLPYSPISPFNFNISKGEIREYTSYGRNITIRVIDLAPYVFSELSYSFKIVARLKDHSHTLMYLGAGCLVLILTTIGVDQFTKEKEERLL
jgi:hypothetical protein